MTKKLLTRALMLAAICAACSVASFAQAPVEARVRRVALDKINDQPVAASVVALQQASALNLTAQQRTHLQAISSEATSLHAERARLWSEYNTIIARPNYDDDMATSQGAPRMLRIVEINNRLSAIAATENSQVTGILNATQRSALTNMVASVRAQGR